MLKYPGKEIPGFHFTGREVNWLSDFTPTENRNVQMDRFNILGYYTRLYCIKSCRDEIFIFICTSMGLEDQLNLYIS